MKIQALAIIGVVLLLPMILILGRYIEHQTQTLSLQVSYDNKLQDSTYDALKAFQLNTSNSDSSDISNSKMRDVKAGCVAFFNSLANNFSMAGADRTTLENYVPAVVFTMYDGYYIYSPYINTLDQADLYNLQDKGKTIPYGDRNEEKKIKDGSDQDTSTSVKDGLFSYSEYYDDQRLVGLRPYIYYSCRYIHGSDIDVTVTYSLDNYVVIKGRAKNTAGDMETIDLHGYLLSDLTYTPNNSQPGVRGDSAEYRETTISEEKNLYEYGYFSGEFVDENGEKGSPFDSANGNLYNCPCRKINGVRYYDLGTINGKKYGVNALLNGIWTRQDYLADDAILNTTNSQVKPEDVETNTNALKYYKEAYELREGINNYKLTDIQAKDAVGKDGNTLKDVETGQAYFGEDQTEIFAELGSSGIGKDNIGIEEKESNFNDHRLKVIKHCIESELVEVINNFNTYSTSTEKFQMPKLKESEWDMIYDNISVLTFLQGLNIGGRIYSGHSVVPNNNNKELVSEDDIQFVGDDNKIYDTTYSGFVGGDKSLGAEDNKTIDLNHLSHGYAKNTLSRVSTENRETGQVYYFYRYPTNLWKEYNNTLVFGGGGGPSGPWFSYESIVTSQKNNTDFVVKDTEGRVYGDNTQYNSIFDYIDAVGTNGNNSWIKEKYYTALARERYGMFRVENEDFVSEYPN